jgi:hypothetical protein
MTAARRLIAAHPRLALSVAYTVLAVAVVGWTLPQGDRFGYVLGVAIAGLGALTLWTAEGAEGEP